MKNFFNSIFRGFGYSIGKFLFLLLIAIVLALLTNVLTITNVFAANFATYDYELNAQLESFNFYDCDKTDCSSTTNKSFLPVMTVNRPDKISYYENTASFTYGTNYGAIWSTRTNLNFVQGQVYTISLLYANNKGYLKEPESAWISYSSGDEKIKVKELNYQAGQLGTCNMGGETFKYCGRLYLSFVAQSNGMWFHFRVKPLATNSYSSGQFFVNSEVGVYTLGTYDERTNLEIYNRLDIQLRSINSSINSLGNSISNSQQTIINNQNSNFNNIQSNQNSNANAIISNANSNQQKTDSYYTDDTENEDGTCNGIICNLKKTVKGIINLPKTFLDAIINALKSLFIPSNDFFMNWINDLMQSFEEQLGFLAYPITFTIDVLNRFYNISVTEPIIVIPPFSDPFYNVIIFNGATWNLNDYVQDGALQVLYLLGYTFINAYIIVNFIEFCRNKVSGVMGSRVEPYEFTTVETVETNTQNNYDGFTKKGTTQSHSSKTRTTTGKRG